MANLTDEQRDLLKERKILDAQILDSLDTPPKKDGTVLDLANELNWPLEYFLLELKAAGINKANAKESLTNEDKLAFLSYIIRFYKAGLTPENKFQSPKSAESNLSDGKNQNLDLGSVFDNYIDQVARFAAKYGSMSQEELSELWNEGKNSFINDERNAIYFAYRQKSKKKIKTEFKIPEASFEKRCPFCQNMLNKKNICDKCGTGFSNAPSLIFDIENPLDGENNKVD